MPGAKKVLMIGAWEEGQFLGVVIFSPGATSQLGAPYGLTQIQCTELVRIALRRHKIEVSRIVSIALRFLKKHAPGIRLIVSFADPMQGHHGGVYQAGNWVYSGKSSSTKVFRVNGKMIHPRSLGASDFKKGQKKKLPANAEVVIAPGKHRYLMPLDDEMRKQIDPLRKPYPKRVRSVDSDTSTVQVEESGANPTRTLLVNEKPDEHAGHENDGESDRATVADQAGVSRGDNSKADSGRR